MFGCASILILFLITLVSSAYVARRDECYNITTSTTYGPSSLSKTTYTFPNATSSQQCQVAITSWLTTTLTLLSSSGDASSGTASSATTSSISNSARVAKKRSAMSTTTPTSLTASPTSNMSSTTTTTINPTSLLSEFASIYSVLTQYEYNATANSSTATASNSINVSAYSTAIGTSNSNSSTIDATSSPNICAASCTACTTVFYIATTTVTKTTPLPSPITTLPPITVGTNTYTATGTYYVIDNSTLSPGGYAILVSNSTLLSLSPSGTELVIAPLSPTAGGPGPSTYDLSPSPASSPPLTTPTPTSTSTSIASKAAKVVEVASATITGPYNLPVVVLPSEPIVIAGTTLTPGSPSATIRETPVSLAPGSAFLVVGSSTITLAMTTVQGGASSTPKSTLTPTTAAQAKVGSLIWSGIGGTELGTSATSTTAATASAATSPGSNATYIGQVFTGAGISFRGKGRVSLCSGLGLGLGVAMAGVLL